MVLPSVLVVSVVVLSPVVFGLLADTQVYVEASVLVSGMVTVPPLQMVTEEALVIWGAGFTVMVMHPPVAVHTTPFRVELATRR